MPVSKTEILTGSSWTDVTNYVRYNDGVSITSGQTGETGRIEPSVCNLVLDNRDGRFSPRNPSSPYFGTFVKGTHLRTAVRGPYMHLRLNADNTDKATTPDAAALDITGDIDIRLDASMHDWGEGVTVELIGKHEDTTNDRSWWLRLVSGSLRLDWSSDGTNAGIRSATSTIVVPAAGVNRMAVRATLDVDNGAGGCTVTFYTAPTINGPWGLLGDPVTATGTTSIYAGTAPLDIGSINDVNSTNPRGMVFAAQVLNGIGGTAVANPDFTIQSEGATGFTDAAGRTWSVQGTATITRYIPRFYGEINDISISGDQSANDSVAQIQASDLMKRMGSASTTLASPLKQQLTNPSRTNIKAYWPCEDEQGSTSLAGYYNAQRMTFTGSPNFATNTQWMGSAPLMAVGDAVLTGNVSNYTSSTQNALRFHAVFPTGGLATDQTLFDLYTNGSAARWKVVLRTSGALAVFGYDSSGATIVTSGDITFNVNGRVETILFELEQTGADIDWTLTVTNYTNVVDIDQLIFGSVASGIAIGETVTKITKVVFGSDGGLGDVVIGHVAVADLFTAFTNTFQAGVGYAGENPNNRMSRLASENGITYQTIAHGKFGNTVEVGRQPVDTVMNILRQTSESDRGILYAARSHQGFVYHSRLSLYNQKALVELNCETGHIGAPLQPVDDDALLANQVTISRAYGSSATASLTTGALSTQDPPDGAGLREYSEEVSLRDDGMVDDHAGWVLHQRTVDEARFPTIMFKLHGNPYTTNDELMHQMLLMRLGDRITITGQPDWLPPEDITQIVVGFSEFFTNHEYNLTIVCLPESVYRVMYIEGLASNYDRADTSGSSLAASITSTATTMKVASQLNAALWTTDVAQLPFDLRMAGEIVQVEPSGTVLTTNPNFETDTSGWTATNATLTRSSVVSRVGGWSGLLTTTAGSNPRVQDALRAVTAGNTYTAVGWLYGPYGMPTQCAVNVNWYDAGSVYMSTSTNAKTLVPNVWTPYNAQFTAPVGAAFGAVLFSISGTPGSGYLLYADNVKLITGATGITDSVSDTFTRVTANGWGTADTGGAWSILAGTTADFSTSGTYGVHTQSTTGAAHITGLTAPGADVDILCDIATDALATGASLFGGPCARLINNNDFYQARLEFTTTNTIVISVRKRVGAVETLLDSVTTPLTHVAGTSYRVRFQCIGSTLRARVWLASAREPFGWQVETTDTSHTAANNVGIRSFSNTGNTNVNPQIRTDNFRIVNPQTFTVMRSVNGVVKSQTAGADVRLANPAIISL